MMDDYSKLLDQSFLQEICDIFLEETNHEVIIVNRDGIIVAATVKSRIGVFHQIAKQVMDGVISDGVVTIEDEKQLKNVRAGVNIPIMYKDQRIMVLGISGDPVEVKPLVGIASRITTLWLQNKERIVYLSEVIKKTQDQLHQITAAIQQTTAGSQEINTLSDMTYKIAIDSNQKVNNMEEVLKSIKKIVSQINIIGLNAAIEAARVGEAGRGFTVVANEIRKLATTSDKSVEEVSSNVLEIKEIFLNITEKIKDNRFITKDQVTALESITDGIQIIDKSMEDLLSVMS